MNDDDKRNAADQLHELQNEAFELLVDEKLAADESFRIFSSFISSLPSYFRQFDSIK